jgi:hypothetical protein
MHTYQSAPDPIPHLLIGLVASWLVTVAAAAAILLSSGPV